MRATDLCSLDFGLYRGHLFNSACYRSLSRVNLIEQLHGVAFAEVLSWYGQLEVTGQMAWIDKNNDGHIQYFGPKKSETGTRHVFLGKSLALVGDGGRFRCDRPSWATITHQSCGSLESQ